MKLSHRRRPGACEAAGPASAAACQALAPSTFAASISSVGTAVSPAVMVITPNPVNAQHAGDDQGHVDQPDVGEAEVDHPGVGQPVAGVQFEGRSTSRRPGCPTVQHCVDHADLRVGVVHEPPDHAGRGERDRHRQDEHAAEQVAARQVPDEDGHQQREPTTHREEDDPDHRVEHGVPELVRRQRRRVVLQPDEPPPSRLTDDQGRSRLQRKKLDTRDDRRPEVEAGEHRQQRDDEPIRREPVQAPRGGEAPRAGWWRRGRPDDVEGGWWCADAIASAPRAGVHLGHRRDERVDVPVAGRTGRAHAGT